jgi:hypothetical protein
MPDERQTHRVTLGCGTLILIALIVLFFSSPASRICTATCGRCARRSRN